MEISEIEQKGLLFDGWKVVRFLGEGGYGKVYEIRREGYGVSVSAALKHICIPKNSGEINELLSEGMDEKSASAYLRGYVEEFSRECELMSRLKGNSHIVSFEDYKVIERTGEIGWDILIRMEMLTPLIDYMKTNTLTRESILKLGISICEALELCKKQNIMHRDIKPANIFISPNGDFKLGDFGISRIISQSNGASTKVGTNDYMAPEVYKGERYDGSVDIYSLGVVLYRFFNNNRLPFLPPAPEAITYSHREEALARRMRGETFPMPVCGDNEIYRIILKATAYNPAARYTDPSELRRDLENLLGGAPAAAPVGAVQPSPYMQPSYDGGQTVQRDLSMYGSQIPVEEDRTVYKPRTQEAVPVAPVAPATVPAKKKGLKPVAIVGIVLGSVFLVILLIVIIVVSVVAKNIRSSNSHMGSVNSYSSSSSSGSSSSSSDSSSSSNKEQDENSNNNITDDYGNSSSGTAVTDYETANNDNETSSVTDGYTSEDSTDNDMNVAASFEEKYNAASLTGNIYSDSIYVVQGDTVNIRFTDGNYIVEYATDLYYQSDDESVATVKPAVNKQSYVVKGINPGKTIIRGVYDDTRAEIEITVVQSVPEKTVYINDICKNGYSTDYDKNEIDVLYISSFGSAKFWAEIWDYYEEKGWGYLEDDEISDSLIIIYSDENLRISVDGGFGAWNGDSDSLQLTLTDVGSSGKGNMTMAVLKQSTQEVMMVVRIPIEIYY